MPAGVAGNSCSKHGRSEQVPLLSLRCAIRARHRVFQDFVSLAEEPSCARVGARSEGPHLRFSLRIGQGVVADWPRAPPRAVRPKSGVGGSGAIACWGGYRDAHWSQSSTPCNEVWGQGVGRGVRRTALASARARVLRALRGAFENACSSGARCVSRCVCVCRARLR